MRPALLCRFCHNLVDLPQRGWVDGDPAYCVAHHALADRDPWVIGQGALDYAEWLHDMESSSLIRWPWKAMNDFAGPLVPGRLTYIAAFPGNGKTSFAAHLLQHFLRVQGKKVTYLPLEADPGETFTRLACLDCGISADDALSKRLRDRADAGDATAKAQHEDLSVAYRLMREDRQLLESLRIEPIDALTPKSFARALHVAHLQESDIVIVDHMDHAENDVGESGPEIALSNQMQSMALRAAKAMNIPMILLTQLNSSRTGGDALAHYRRPLVDWLYNKGKKEQMAANIFGLSRVLDPNAASDALQDVRAGRRDVSTIVLPDVMEVSGMKMRYGGASRDKSIKLRYLRGHIMDMADDDGRDVFASQHGIAMGSPSNWRVA
jgi:KaiC/GvpD/RAD55 family RecA-like ATPase